MSSLYLGQISTKDITYQIHAFTKGLPFREFSISQISDPMLFEAMLRGRYDVTTSGRSVHWSGLDKERHWEYNPHDDRPGTFHIAALDPKNQMMLCAASVAVDLGEKYHGELIGLPLENRWKKDELQSSSSLDKFRQSYFAFNYGLNKPVEPYQMVELYRHFRVKDIDAYIPRIGIAAGAYQVLFREAIRREAVPSSLWVFDAIVPFFNLYRMVGAAVLRDFTLRSSPRYISPDSNQITYQQLNGKTYAYWNGELISQSVPDPRPYIENEKITYKMEEITYLSGLVDLQIVEKAIKESPIELLPLKHEGITEADLRIIRVAVSIVGRCGYEEYYQNNPRVMSIINQYSDVLGIKSEFSNIGSTQKQDTSK